MPWMAVRSLARNRRSLGSAACRNTGPRLPGNAGLPVRPLRSQILHCLANLARSAFGFRRLPCAVAATPALALSCLTQPHAGVAAPLMPVATTVLFAYGLRGVALERAAARVCRETGTQVAVNVLLRDLSVQVQRQDNRRIEVIANGLPLWEVPSSPLTQLWSCPWIQLSSRGATSAAPREPHSVSPVRPRSAPTPRSVQTGCHRLRAGRTGRSCSVCRLAALRLCQPASPAGPQSCPSRPPGPLQPVTTAGDGECRWTLS